MAGDRSGVLRFSFSAGFLIRRDAVRKIKGICHSLGVQLTLDEDKGFLDSMFYGVARGAEPKLRVIMEWLKAVDDIDTAAIASPEAE